MNRSNILYFVNQYMPREVFTYPTFDEVLPVHQKVLEYLAKHKISARYECLHVLRHSSDIDKYLSFFQPQKNHRRACKYFAWFYKLCFSEIVYESTPQNSVIKSSLLHNFCLLRRCWRNRRPTQWPPGKHKKEPQSCYEVKKLSFIFKVAKIVLRSVSSSFFFLASACTKPSSTAWSQWSTLSSPQGSRGKKNHFWEYPSLNIT